MSDEFNSKELDEEGNFKDTPLKGLICGDKVALTDYRKVQQTLNSASLKITRGENKAHFGPLEDGRDCPTCRHFTRAYLHHLFKAKELTGLGKCI